MPQISLRPGSKGLVQSTGSVVTGEAVAESALHTMAGNDETITTAGKLLCRVDPAGSRTGVILEAGTVDGQLAIVMNCATAGAAETITFAAHATSNVGLGTAAVIAGGGALLCVWDATLERWIATET